MVAHTLAQIADGRAPRVKLPYALVLALAHLDQWVEGGILRRTPFIPLEGIREARRPVWVDCSKAVRELGLPQSPVEGALDGDVEPDSQGGRHSNLLPSMKKPCRLPLTGKSITDIDFPSIIPF